MDDSRLDKTLSTCLFIGVALAPLPFGSVHPWAWGSFAIYFGCLLVAWSAARLCGATSAKAPLRMTWPLMIVCLVVFSWALFQAAPGTPPALRHPIWAEASAALGQDLVGSISVSPENSIASVVRLSIYWAVFWLAIQLGRNSSFAKNGLKAIVLAGVLYAAYGLGLKLFSIERVLWIKKFAYTEDVTSTFINRNHYATFTGISLICEFGLLFDSFSKKITRTYNKRETISELFKYMEKDGWPHILGILIMLSALFYSHSRAGFASSIFGLSIFCLCAGLSTTSNKAMVKWLAGLSIAGIALFFVASGHSVDERIANTNLDTEERPIVYAATLKAIENQPLVGTGLGTFEEVFRYYRPASLRDIFAQAHNSYLETALELGVPATILILLGICYVGAVNIYGLRTRRRDPFYACVGLGISALMATHALVDFSIQIPAVAIVYAMTLGLSFSQSWSTRKESAW